MGELVGAWVGGGGPDIDHALGIVQSRARGVKCGFKPLLVCRLGWLCMGGVISGEGAAA